MDEHQRHRHRFRYETPATAGAIKGSIWLGSGNSRCVVSAVVPCARVMLFRPRQRHNRQDQQQTDRRTSCRYKFNSEKKQQSQSNSKDQNIRESLKYSYTTTVFRININSSTTNTGWQNLENVSKIFGWLVGWGTASSFPSSSC